MRGKNEQMKMGLQRQYEVDRDVRENGRYHWSEGAHGRVWIQGVRKYGMFQKPNSYIQFYPL